jgi:hypothetical protein
MRETIELLLQAEVETLQYDGIDVFLLCLHCVRAATNSVERSVPSSFIGELQL